MGSLNINGGRDKNKLAQISEFLRIEKVYVCFFYKKRIQTLIMKLNGDYGGKEILL